MKGFRFIRGHILDFVVLDDGYIILEDREVYKNCPNVYKIDLQGHPVWLATAHEKFLKGEWGGLYTALHVDGDTVYVHNAIGKGKLDPQTGVVDSDHWSREW